MSLLEEIVSSTRKRVEQTKTQRDPVALRDKAAARTATRGFVDALTGEEVAIIAEIKRRSPSKGPFNLGLDAADTARAFADGGAAAVSVLTEPHFFQGSMNDLESAAVADVPLLLKDFVLDPVQVLEARASGADAFLLIVRVVGGALNSLITEVRSLGMDALVEVYDERDVDIALDAGAMCIGINNRDLETFEVDPERTRKLASGLPREVVVVALSGISTRAEVEDLVSVGASAVLIGESLVTAPDPAAKLRELRGVS